MGRFINNLSVLLVASLLTVGSLGAQTSVEGTGAGLEAGMRISTLRDGTEPLWGGAALIHLHPRISVGGGGWLLVGRSQMAVPSPGSDLEMTFGYGGILTEFRLLTGGTADVAVRLLAGAGNAKILVPVVGSEIGADNFGILEPEIATTVRLFPPVALRVSAGYLYSFGVEDLPRILAEDLRAYSLGLSVAVGLP